MWNREVNLSSPPITHGFLRFPELIFFLDYSVLQKIFGVTVFASRGSARLIADFGCRRSCKDFTNKGKLGN